MSARVRHHLSVEEQRGAGPPDCLSSVLDPRLHRRTTQSLVSHQDYSMVLQVCTVSVHRARISAGASALATLREPPCYASEITALHLARNASGHVHTQHLAEEGVASGIWRRRAGLRPIARVAQAPHARPAVRARLAARRCRVDPDVFRQGAPRHSVVCVSGW